MMTASACRDPDQWPLLSAALPHAEEFFERGIQRLERSSENEEVRVVLSVGMAVGLFLAERGLSLPSRGVGERVLAQALRILGPEDPETLKAMGNLALTLSAMGELERARMLQERMLEGMHRLLGEHHPYTLKARNNLALTLLEQGDLEGARMHPPFALPFERVVPEGGVTILGHYLPAGTVVGGNPYVVNRYKAHFGDDAELWRPERWIEGGRRSRKSWSRAT